MVTPMFSDTAGLERLVNLNTQRLRTAAQMAIRFVEFHGLSYYKPVAGLYIWLRLSDDCSTFDEEEALVQRCSQRGVFVGSGADYSEPQPGWFRLTFALPEEKLLEGLRRIEEAMGYEKVFNTREQDFHVRLTNWWRGMGL